MPQGGTDRVSAPAARENAARPPLRLVPSSEERARALDFYADDAFREEDLPPSPLELPYKSYALPEEGPENDNPLTHQRASNGNAYAPSMLMEMQAQRAREEHMRQTAEHFVGAETLPSEPENDNDAAETDPQSASAERPNRPRKEDAPEGEEILEPRQRRPQGKTARPVDATITDDAKTEALKQAFRMFRTGTAVTLVGVIVALFVMNVQLFNQFTFKNSNVPELDFWEVLLTLVLDLLILAALILLFGLFIAIIAGLFGA